MIIINSGENTRPALDIPVAPSGTPGLASWIQWIIQGVQHDLIKLKWLDQQTPGDTRRRRGYPTSKHRSLGSPKIRTPLNSQHFVKQDHRHSLWSTLSLPWEHHHLSELNFFYQWAIFNSELLKISRG